MKTTFELIEQYLLSNTDDKGIKLENYYIEDNIIKIKYSYQVIIDNHTYSSYNNYFEVGLLNYITFLFNFKNTNN